MRSILTFILASILCLSSCVRATDCQRAKKEIVSLESKDDQDDEKEIQKLIQTALDWSASSESVVVYPISKKGGFYFFDKNKLRENLTKLKASGFFSDEFIENYNQIILTLDAKLRNKEFDEWMVGDLPPFKFANDIDPWCLCQGFSAQQFDGIRINKMDSRSGELTWNWKRGNSWTDFKFRVVKENNKWKISYMQGFDFEEGVKRDGEM